MPVFRSRSREDNRTVSRAERICIAACAIVSFFTSLGVCRAELLDRFVATVNGAVILESEIMIERAFLESDLVPDNRRMTGLSRREILDRLITRRLMLNESARFKEILIQPERIDEAVEAITQRTGGSDRLDAQLRTIGLSPNEFRRRIQDQLTLEAYVDQRIRAFIQIQTSDVADYLVTHRESLHLKGLTPVELLSEAQEELIHRITNLLREEKVNERLDLQAQSLVDAADIRIIQADD